MNTNPREKAVIDVGTEAFDSEVLRSEQPVLVAFRAPWSDPCLVLDATLDEVAATSGEALKVVRVNADDYPDLSLCYDIRFIPTLLLFVDGQVCGRIVGTCSKEAIVSMIRTSRSHREGRVSPGSTTRTNEGKSTP